jgi:cytochrome c biogenesis protein CcdA
MNLTLPTVLAAALVDCINPCAIGVIIFLIAALLRLRANRTRMLLAGCIYTAAVFITYFLAGLGLLHAIQRLQIANQASMIVGVLVIIAGFIEIKDFFWYGKGFSLEIPYFAVKRIKRIAQTAALPAMVVLGFFVALFELPCTGGPYLAITALLSYELTASALGYLFIYNLIFILPLIAILVLAYFGTSTTALEKWKMKYRRWMRLAAGLLLIALGILLILYRFVI